jgi:hypothetical protein
VDLHRPEMVAEKIVQEQVVELPMMKLLVVMQASMKVLMFQLVLKLLKV